MGADLYWEQRNYNPKPDKLQWNVDGTATLYRDDWYYKQYFKVWTGKVTDEMLPLLKALGVDVPEKEK